MHSYIEVFCPVQFALVIVKIDINILYGLRREKYWPDVIERGDGALPHAHIHTPYRTTWIKLLKEGENIINVSVWYFIFVTGRFKFIHTPISCLKVLFKSFDIYIYIYISQQWLFAVLYNMYCTIVRLTLRNARPQAVVPPRGVEPFSWSHVF